MINNKNKTQIYNNQQLTIHDLQLHSSIGESSSDGDGENHISK